MPSAETWEAPVAFHHTDSDAVRFWVPIAGGFVGASIRRAVLKVCFPPHDSEEEPITTYARHADELGAAVRRRVDRGSIEPVMLREFDLKPVAGNATASLV